MSYLTRSIGKVFHRGSEKDHTFLHMVSLSLSLSISRKELRVRKTVNLDDFDGGVSVLGAENSGKTQTLARIIGVDMIPSAHGISTRLLTVINMINDPVIPADQPQIIRSTSADKRESNKLYVS